jgi:hypothetical protein
MALGSTQLVTEMSIRNLPGGGGGVKGGRPASKIDNIADRHLYEYTDCLETLGALTVHSRMGLHGLLQE